MLCVVLILGIVGGSTLIAIGLGLLLVSFVLVPVFHAAELTLQLIPFVVLFFALVGYFVGERICRHWVPEILKRDLLQQWEWQRKSQSLTSRHQKSLEPNTSNPYRPPE